LKYRRQYSFGGKEIEEVEQQFAVPFHELEHGRRKSQSGEANDQPLGRLTAQLLGIDRIHFTDGRSSPLDINYCARMVQESNDRSHWSGLVKLSGKRVVGREAFHGRCFTCKGLRAKRRTIYYESHGVIRHAFDCPRCSQIKHVPPGLDIEFEAPRYVRSGEQFEVVARVPKIPGAFWWAASFTERGPGCVQLPACLPVPIRIDQEQQVAPQTMMLATPGIYYLRLYYLRLSDEAVGVASGILYVAPRGHSD
jgi:hypothetical protein